jgi:hypothetical protein
VRAQHRRRSARKRAATTLRRKPQAPVPRFGDRVRSSIESFDSQLQVPAWLGVPDPDNPPGDNDPRLDLHARTMYLYVLDDADAAVESMRLVVETTAKPNVAGGVSAKKVNSDPRATCEEEEFLQISRCALL